MTEAGEQITDAQSGRSACKSSAAPIHRVRGLRRSRDPRAPVARIRALVRGLGPRFAAAVPEPQAAEKDGAA